MICPHCRAGEHDGKPDACPGKGQCNCQHRKPRRDPDPGCGARGCEVAEARLYACGWRCSTHAP